MTFDPNNPYQQPSDPNQGQPQPGPGQPGDPYGASSSPYGASAPGTPYGASAPGTPYGAPAPGTPYGAMSSPGMDAYAQPQADAGKGMGIAALVAGILACIPLASIVAIILGFIGLKRSKASGYGNVMAIIGIALGALGTIGWIIIGVITGIGVAELMETCDELGPGTHYVNGTTYECNF